MSQTDDVERGPNGIPFVSMDRTIVGQWESGEFRVCLARTDGDVVNANFRESQLKALRKAIDKVLEEGREASCSGGDRDD